MSTKGVALTVMLASAISGGAVAQQRDLRAERQQGIEFILTTASSQTVVRVRGNCATGGWPQHVASNRAAGAHSQPDATEECVAALTRIARDGTLGFVRDMRSDVTAPSLAFDNGFVTGFRSRGPLPAGLPTMATLKPVVERCLAQNERVSLCNAAGQAFGQRTAQGETVRVM